MYKKQSVYLTLHSHYVLHIGNGALCNLLGPASPSQQKTPGARARPRRPDSKTLSQKAQLAIHNATLIPTLKYGSESWIRQKQHVSRINAVEMRGEFAISAR